jgi:Ser/Thr protein kinase RdoA (MazF antagonist)
VSGGGPVGPDVALSKLLEQYTLPDSRWSVEPTGSPGGLSGAQIWKIRSGWQCFAVRRWPIGTCSERLSALHRFLQYLQSESDVPTACPSRTRDGRTAVKQAARWWQLEGWLPGCPDDGRCPCPEKLTAGLSALAHWHLAAGRYRPLEQDHTWFRSAAAAIPAAVTERLTKLERAPQPQANSVIPADADRDITLLTPTGLPATSLSPVGLSLTPNFDPQSTRTVTAESLIAVIDRLPALLSAAWPIARQRLSGVAELTVPVQPCLRDVWVDHLLFERNQVTGWLDPAAARTDTVVSDLTRLLGTWVEDDPALWAIGLAAYQRVRPLNDHEVALLPAVDLAGVVLSAAHWVEWRQLQNRPGVNTGTAFRRVQQLHRRLAAAVHQPSLHAPLWI